jgi:hypothetical protein
VLKACLYEPEFNPVYLSFSKHYGFLPNPCFPYHPEQKGRVEKDIDYTKRNALKGRKFKSLAEGNIFLKSWNKKWARTRIHGTTKRQVWPQFINYERDKLKKLPANDLNLFSIGTRKVDVHAHIEIKSNFYSVPHYMIGQNVHVQFNNIWVKVLNKGEVICQHKALTSKGKRRTDQSHYPS